MIHLNSRLLCGSALAAVLALASCQSELPGPDRNEQFIRDFITEFGVFDPRHDWNMATQASVTVTVASPSDIRVYARVDGKRYLFGTFSGVEGSGELKVDVPKGVRNLIVRCGGRDYHVADGAHLDLASRSMHPASAAPGTLAVRRAPASSDIMAHGSYVGRYDDILPEEKPNINRREVSKNFQFTNPTSAPVDIEIHPVMWNTSNVNTLGIYYTDADGMYREQDIYTIKHGDELTRFKCAQTVSKYADNLWTGTNMGKYFTAAGVDPGLSSYTSEQRQALLAALVADGWRASSDDLSLNPSGPSIWLPGDDFEGQPVPAWKMRLEGRRWEQESLEGAQVTLGAWNCTDDYVYRSAGIRVTIPAGLTYGMYIRRSDGKMRYSQASLNPDPDDLIDYIYEYGPDGTPQKITVDYRYAPPYAATFTRADLTNSGLSGTAGQYRRVCFEDWFESSSDRDLNDMVFYIKGISDSHVVEDEDPADDVPYKWIIAAEDLGSKDFDYNDVVFGVSDPHTVIINGQTQKYVKIRPLAAGGTLPVYICYQGKVIIPEGNKAGGEFHSWFRNSHSSGNPINVGSYAPLGVVVNLAVSPDFTLAANTGVAQGNMGGFTLKVIHKDGSEIVWVENPSLDSGSARAPQMICVTSDWFWPKESSHISGPYPRFAAWATDMNSNTDWFKIPVTSDVVRHSYATDKD